MSDWLLPAMAALGATRAPTHRASSWSGSPTRGHRRRQGLGETVRFPLRLSPGGAAGGHPVLRPLPVCPWAMEFVPESRSPLYALSHLIQGSPTPLGHRPVPVHVAVRNRATQQQVSGGQVSKASPVSAVAPRRRRHRLSPASDHQALDSHGTTGPWSQRGWDLWSVVYQMKVLLILFL